MASLAQSRNISNLLQTSQQKAISTGVLTLALVAALLWGSFKPTVTTIIETSNKYEEKSQLLEKMETQNTRLTNLTAQRNELAVELGKLDAYFPYDGDYSLFVTNLNELARKQGFLLSGVTFSSNYIKQLKNAQVLRHAGLVPITFQISMNGNPANIPQFISFLENMPFLPKILAVNYTPNHADPNKTSISITVLVYKLNTQAAP